MKYVLVACEESQRVCKAFRDLGAIAFSCDLQKCRNYPHWHIQGDVLNILNGFCTVETQDGSHYKIPNHWDLIIAHPPCTYLCKVSSVQMVKNGQIDHQRFRKMQEARIFFLKMLNAQSTHIAVENPLPMARAHLPKPTTYIQPYWYGEKYSKKTLLWLKNLPPLMPTLINPEYKEFVRSSRGKYRSRTFDGVAKAMATQWLPLI